MQRLPMSRTAILSSVLLTTLLLAVPLQAAIVWDGEAGTSWWFDPVNWNVLSNANDRLPPSGDGYGVTDTQINNGWNVPGEGVVFDPVNDPYFPNAGSYQYPPQYEPDVPNYLACVQRFYIGRNTTNTNILTIKSGTLFAKGWTAVGRSGGNTSKLVQVGGTFRVDTTLDSSLSLDLGNFESSGPANGIYEYYAGRLEVALSLDEATTASSRTLRLSAGGSAGTGGVGRFIMKATGPGYVRVLDLNVAAHGGNGDGVTTGVGIVEFHYINGGVRPFQILRNLIINNGLDSDGVGYRSARLALVLDEMPQVDSNGVPVNLGLFDTDFNNNGLGGITGTGDLGQFFSSEDASTLYTEGAIISATYGGYTFNWRITYTGKIIWADPDNSIVASVLPTGGEDVVLIGLSSDYIPVPPLLGDTNNDGVVDLADYNNVVNNLGATGPNQLGDTNRDEVVDLADYNNVVNNLGATRPASLAVPEPASLALLSLAGLLALPRRNRA